MISISCGRKINVHRNMTTFEKTPAQSVIKTSSISMNCASDKEPTIQDITREHLYNQQTNPDMPLFYLRELSKKCEDEGKHAMRKHLEKFFRFADVDENGSLTLEELTMALRQQGYVGSTADIARFFNLADTSDDQVVTFDEYMAAMMDAPMIEHSKAAMKRVFKMFDKDGNGSIEKSELAQVFREMGKHFRDEDIQQMVDLADADSSGTLEIDEFINIVASAITEK